jgi:hypothetical protein
VNVYIVVAGRAGERHIPEAAFPTLRKAKAHVWEDHRINVGNEHSDGAWKGSLDGFNEVWIYRRWLDLHGGAS